MGRNLPSSEVTYFVKVSKWLSIQNQNPNPDPRLQNLCSFHHTEVSSFGVLGK
jgi:hypothetical protein